MSKHENMLLSLKELSLGFGTKKEISPVVKTISFDVMEGEIVGIVGESGSGKSVTALSIARLLAAEGKAISGEIWFDGRNLLKMTEKDMEKIRGNEISYVFQEPMTSLNPVLTIQRQLEEVLLLHEKLTKEERYERMIAILSEVELQEPERVLSCYPHQLSGGMRQRVMIAMAMICRPRLLIADEPTTALDMTVQAKILKLLKKLKEEFHTTIILISHDLSVIRSICNRVIVMYQGEIVEQGAIEDIFTKPKQNYTKQLLEAALLVHTVDVHAQQFKLTDEKPLLKVKDLKVAYTEKKVQFLKRPVQREVVKGVSFTIQKGEILGIVGESGCGKSTLAKAIVGLAKEKEGTIELSCKKPQMVFQDPYSSLNPSKTIGWLLEEPLLLSKKYPKQERRAKVLEMLERVGLSKEYADRYPANLSGGQRQRVAIAMAMIQNQEFIILDEPVSALDVTVQEQILKLLLELREEYELTYLFISHDMGVIQKICDRVGVMYQGKIIELRPTKELFANPNQEYTKQLLNAVLLDKSLIG